MKGQKIKIDTPAGQRELIKEVLAGVKVPDYIKLAKQEMHYWEAITKARKDWTEHDLIVAANLAQTYYEIDKLKKRLKREGYLIADAKGNMRSNPLQTIINQMTTQAATMSRLIQVHALATQGDSHVQAARNAQKKKMLDRLEQAAEDSEDGLLARPANL